MFYQWDNESKKLTRTGAKNLSGLIGTKNLKTSSYCLLNGTDESSFKYDLYKKKDSEREFLINFKVMGIEAYVKIDSGLGALMSYLTFQRDFLDLSDYLDAFDDDSDDGDDQGDDDQGDDEDGGQGEEGAEGTNGN